MSGFPKMLVRVLILLLGTAVAAAAQAGTSAKNDYADPASWLCRPGRPTDACGRSDQNATVLRADGSTRRERFHTDPGAPIDCFYVYPTVSTDPTPNSDMVADAAERNVIRQQFARFAAKCRPYAPMYRQITLAGLRKMLAGGGGGSGPGPRPAI